jgi:hypothetical protein
MGRPRNFAIAVFNAARIQERIAHVAVTEAALPPEVARDVAIHMTDWLDDLAVYVRFCQSPEELTTEQVNELLLAFLVHVPNHLAAAAKLYADLPVADIFSVGAVLRTSDGDA